MAEQRLRNHLKALRQCKKVKSHSKRNRCESRVKKKFGPLPPPSG